MNEGWMLPLEAFEWIFQTIPEGSMILEFGSGDGSQRLADRYQLWSVEHDNSWLNQTTSNYVHAPIVSNPVSDKHNEQGWYNRSLFENVPAQVSLIIVDGPPGIIGRNGLVHYLSELPKTEWILVDDTDRIAEQNLSRSLVEFFQCKHQRIITKQYKANGDIRIFDILRIGD
jgi:hypothetical protein